MMQEGVGWFGTATTPLTINVREAVNNAQVLGQNIPTQMYAGQRQELAVTMQNTGDLPWTRTQQYTLMAQAPHNNMTWGLNRVPLPVETVNPGESTTFRFVVTAPANLDTYASQWGMQREGHGSFGGSTSVAWVNVREPINNAQPVAQDVPLQMESGKSYNVSVTMANNGESTWTRDKLYTLMSHNPQNNTTWGNNRVPLPVDNIAPGQSVTFNFPVTAPSKPGSYAFQWGMQREYYGAFGPGTATATINVPSVDNALVLSMSAPSPMVTGKSYAVTVAMRNTGNTTWTAGVHTLGSANPYDNFIWGVSRVALTRNVAPGEDYSFNFQVTAPGAGDYTMAWGVLSQTAWFGALVSKPVTVTEDLSRTTFIHTDGLGSPVARTDGAGNLVSRTRYEPYGYVASGAAPTIGFTGHVNDADTGLTYMQQRYYDPVAGRFLSVDPVSTDANTGSSFNRYAYANNNPYRYIDPDGRDAVAIVFPDYKIQTPIGKMGGLGHAGVLSIDNKTGATKYYEYGRYNKGEGAVRTVSVPNVVIGKDGSPTTASLNKTLDTISSKSGQGGSIQAAYISGADPKKMESYAQQQMQAANAGETSYSLMTNNCATFMKDTIQAGGVDMPSMVDPRPNSYIKEVQSDFPKIDHVK